MWCASTARPRERARHILPLSSAQSLLQIVTEGEGREHVLLRRQPSCLMLTSDDKQRRISREKRELLEFTLSQPEAGKKLPTTTYNDDTHEQTPSYIMLYEYHYVTWTLLHTREQIPWSYSTGKGHALCNCSIWNPLFFLHSRP